MSVSTAQPTTAIWQPVRDAISDVLDAVREPVVMRLSNGMIKVTNWKTGLHVLTVAWDAEEVRLSSGPYYTRLASVAVAMPNARSLERLVRAQVSQHNRTRPKVQITITRDASDQVTLRLRVKVNVWTATSATLGGAWREIKRLAGFRSLPEIAPAGVALEWRTNPVVELHRLEAFIAARLARFPNQKAELSECTLAFLGDPFGEHQIDIVYKSDRVILQAYKTPQEWQEKTPPRWQRIFRVPVNDRQVFIKRLQRLSDAHNAHA